MEADKCVTCGKEIKHGDRLVLEIAYVGNLISPAPGVPADFKPSGALGAKAYHYECFPKDTFPISVGCSACEDKSCSDNLSGGDNEREKDKGSAPAGAPVEGSKTTGDETSKKETSPKA